jgi:tetratricopeptide (TPR) repeat protein
VDSLVAEVVDEFRERQKRGEQPTAEEYAVRYPEAAALLRKVLASLELLSLSAAEGATDGAAPPATLGDFQIVREIGRGGMGVVYEAEQLSLGRRVALKVLPLASTMDPRQLQRFHNEARAAAGLHHTNIVPVYGVGCERGVHYYAMQFIDGRTLADVIAQQQGPPPSQMPTTARAESRAAAGSAPTVPQAAQATSTAPRDAAYFRRAAEWGMQAAEALDCAHALGVVHRDVKPANLLVDAAGRLWVTDFGLAQVQSDARLTMTGDLVGTLRYMSPEQALAKRVVVDHRTDVYSLGATFYELLTLQPAFAGSDRQELLRQIAFEEPKPPRRIHRSIPAELQTIVLKAMEKNAADRYTTAKELAEDLRRYLEDKPILARRPSLALRFRKWARRHTAAVRAAAVCLVVTLAAIVGSVGWALGDRGARQREAEAKVREALDAAAPRLRQGNPWDPALMEAAQRAAAQLNGGMVSPEWQARVEQLLRDLDMLKRLEKARLQPAASSPEGYDFAGGDRLYAEAFRAYGIDVAFPDPEEAAEKIRTSGIRTQLVAALDDWAFLLGRMQKGKGTAQTEVANRADDDPWRQELRRAAIRKDLATLQRLAKAPEVLRQLPATIVLLAHYLWPVGQEELLRAAQQQHAADFWLTYELACSLHIKEPADPGETVRFFQAAVALRPQSAAVHALLGNALRANGQLDNAITECKEAIRLQPDFAAAHNNLGGAWDAKRQLDKAIAAYQEAIHHQPDFAAAHNNLGAALFEKGHLDNAITAYQEAIRLQPDYALAHHNLGIAWEAKGELDKAIAAHLEAIHYKPDYALAHNNLGSAWLTKGQLDKAIAALQKAISLQQSYAEAHNNLGNALRAKGQLDDAIAAYQEATRLKPKLAAAHNNLGSAWIAKKQLDKAIAALQKAISLQPKLAEAYNNLGLALRAKGELDNAIAKYQEAIRLKRNYAEAYNNLGFAWSAKAQVDKAIAAFQGAIYYKPDFAEAHNNLGLALAHRGQLDNAIAAYQDAIYYKPDYAEAHHNLGSAWLTKGQLDNAIAAFQEAICLQPDRAEVHYSLGLAWSGKRQLDKAIAAYQEAIYYKPDHAEAHNNLGNAWSDKGQLDNAVAEFQEAIRLKPDYALAHYNLGNAWSDKGQLDNAIAEFQEAIRLKPDYAEAHCNLGHALTAKGQFTEALVYLRRGDELGSKNPHWPYPTGQWVRDCERLIALDAKLPPILSGAKQPADAAERLALAELCQMPCKKLYAAAQRFYSEAFAAEPKWAADLNKQSRYNAACAGALAGCGQGQDADQLDAKERARLRQQALDWLRADLKEYQQAMAKAADRVSGVVAQRLQHWLQDRDFAGVRGAEALAKLPEVERQQWQKLWEEVEALRQRAAKLPAAVSPTQT